MAAFFRRILVPLDTGPTTQKALPHLSHLLSGTAEETVLEEVADDPFLADAARMYVDGIAHRLHHLGLHVRTRVDVGPPVEAILDAAKEEDADAILLSALLRPGVSHVVFEEAAEGVVRKSRIPVLVLRPGEAGWGRDPAIKTILVPLDGSPVSRQALPLAEGLARCEGSRLVLLHVVRGGPEAGRDPGADPTAWDPAFADGELSGAVRDLASRGIEARARVTTGDPAECILRTAESESADMIVMTTHGRSGLSALLLGSVTDRILRTAPTPVLVVSQAGRGGAARAA
ncbi:MAG TPA: universal stress protein [Planctomycetota bacterium]|nr:universal stress protein [Planctomycetota bacterium]